MASYPEAATPPLANFKMVDTESPLSYPGSHAHLYMPLISLYLSPSLMFLGRESLISSMLPRTGLRKKWGGEGCTCKGVSSCLSFLNISPIDSDRLSERREVDETAIISMYRHLGVKSKNWVRLTRGKDISSSEFITLSSFLEMGKLGGKKYRKQFLSRKRGVGTQNSMGRVKN
jgi:hypothetical protein